MSSRSVLFSGGCAAACKRILSKIEGALDSDLLLILFYLDIVGFTLFLSRSLSFDSGVSSVDANVETKTVVVEAGA